jgi:hypothetical protein
VRETKADKELRERAERAARIAKKDEANAAANPTQVNGAKAGIPGWQPREWTQEDLDNPLDGHYKDFLYIHDIEGEDRPDSFLRYVFMSGATEALATLKFGSNGIGYSMQELIVEACVATNNVPDEEVGDAEEDFSPEFSSASPGTSFLN